MFQRRFAASSPVWFPLGGGEAHTPVRLPVLAAQARLGCTNVSDGSTHRGSHADIFTPPVILELKKQAQCPNVSVHFVCLSLICAEEEDSWLTCHRVPLQMD